jgi:hypothetical protein
MSHDPIIASFVDELQKIAEQEDVRSATLLGAKSGVSRGPAGSILGGILGAFRARARNEVLHKKPVKMKKTAAVGSTWGKNLGKTWGRSSNKAGWATKYRSAGMTNPKPSTRKMPRMAGSRTLPGSLGKMPKPVAEANNQVTLRRSLSNIETPEPK